MSLFIEGKLFNKTGAESGGGGGGGDQHNLGWYETPTALRTAHPLAGDGDWAIVGSTDTVWVWDSDSVDWVDSDQKGQVTSVNGKTGVVNLSAWDVNALLQSSTAPEANIENLGKIYQLVGSGTALDGTFWKCVADSRVISTGAVDIITFTGSITDTPLPTVNLVDTNAFDTFLQTYCEGATISQVDPLITFEIVADEDEQGAFVSFACNNGNISGWIDLESLTLENILTALTEMGFSVTLNGDTGFYALDGKLPFTAGTIYWEQINVQPSPDPLPAQTGHSGEFLTTDGTNASWATVDALPSQTGNAGKFLVTDGTDASWSDTVGHPLYIKSAGLYYAGVVELKGYNNNNDILQMNMTPQTGQFEIDVRNNTGTRTGWYFFDSAFYPQATMTTSTLGKSTNVWANVFTAKINNGADITVPNQAGTMVVADSTSATAGQVLTLDSNLQPLWQTINALQNTATGNNSLTVGGTAATVSYSTNIGTNSQTSGNSSVAIGYNARTTQTYGIAIGINANATGQYAIQIGGDNKYNSDANTFKVGNANGNFEIMSADGTIPAARHASLPATDGTYVLKLVIASGVPTLSWVAE